VEDHVRAAAVALLVACSAILVALAVDVLRWPGQLERVNVRLAAGSYGTPVQPPETWLPAGTTERLLGVGEDVEFRRTLRMYRSRRFLPELERLHFGGGAEREAIGDALLRAAAGDGSSELRAQAHVLHGVLVAEEARSIEIPPETFLRRALADFVQSVRLHPESEAARFDVEVVLRLLDTVRRERGKLRLGAHVRPERPQASSGVAGDGY
jgi:hypothetical protein